MCGRYALIYDGDEIAKMMTKQMGRPVKPPQDEYQKSFNVAPTNMVPIYYPPGVHSQTDVNENETKTTIKNDPCTLLLMRWGFIPHWAKDEEQFKGYATINARLENIKSNKLYGQALGAKRCVIPISGYYEWTKPDPKSNKSKLKIPYYVTRKDSDDLMYLAGLYDYNSVLDIHTFSIITGHAPENLEWLHLRMPCVLEPGSKAWKLWLEDQNKTEWTQKELTELLKPWYDEEHYTCYEVSKDVGKVTNKEEYLIEPVSAPKESVKEEGKKFTRRTKKEEEEAGGKVPKLTKAEREEYERLKEKGDIKEEGEEEEEEEEEGEESYKEEMEEGEEMPLEEEGEEEEGEMPEGEEEEMPEGEEASSSLGEESPTPARSSSVSSGEEAHEAHKRKPNVVEMMHMGKKKRVKH